MRPRKLRKKEESLPRNEYAQALDSLTRYLALRDHSRYELKTKLLRRFDPELVDRLMAEADENGSLLAEEQVAERLVLALERQKKSRRYIEAQLMKRHLPKVKQEEETEVEIIRKLIERKFGISKMTIDVKAKAYRFLKYRGFDDRAIKQVLNEKQ